MENGVFLGGGGEAYGEKQYLLLNYANRHGQSRPCTALRYGMIKRAEVGGYCERTTFLLIQKY